MNIIKKHNILPLGFLLALAIAVPAHAAFLLSDNVDRGVSNAGAYPFDVPLESRITTGATYSYLIDDSGNEGIGNTDEQIRSNDPSLLKLSDGFSERVGSAGASYGGWQSHFGATILFDLKDVYKIESVSVSLQNQGNAGIATFQVFTSQDGITWDALGVWDGSKTILDAELGSPGRNTEVSIGAAALTEARYIKIFLSHWNEDHTSRIYNQLALGEVAIWGSPAAIPEPSVSTGVAGLILLTFISGRRKLRG